MATTTATEPPFEEIRGVLDVGLGGALTTSNFWAYLGDQSTTYNGLVLGHSQPSLYTVSVPDFLHIPVLATVAAPDLEQEGGRWIVTIPLREGYLWSDGDEVTAHDFVFTVGVNEEFALGANWIANHPIMIPDDPGTEADEEVRWAEGVEALDDHTVRITFAASENPPGLVVYQNGILFHPILPQHFWQPIIEECRTEDDPTACLFAADGVDQPSAGPLIFDSWEPGVGATLVANPTYYYRGVTYTVYDNMVFEQTGGVHDLDETFYGEPSGTILSQYTDGPFVEQVRLLEYDTQDAVYHAFLRGDLDYAPGVAIGEVEVAIRDRLHVDPDVETVANPSEGFWYLAFNLRKPPMDDPAFRRALALLIDKEFVAHGVLAAQAIPIYSLIPPQNTFWYTDDVTRWGYGMTEAERLEAAVQVLADVGYTWTVWPQALIDDDGNPTGVFVDGEGMARPDGTPIPVLGLLATGPDLNPSLSTFAAWISQWGERLGIPIDMDQTHWMNLAATVFPPKTPEEALGWDMYVFYWGGGDPSLPCTSHQAFFGAGQDVVTGGGFNTPGYDNPEFEALSEAHDLASDIDEARPICADMERNIAENLPCIVLFSGPTLEAWRTNVEFPVTEILGGLSSFADGFLGQVKIHD